MVPIAHTKNMMRMSECKRIHRLFGATDTRVVAEGLQKPRGAQPNF